MWLQKFANGVNSCLIDLHNGLSVEPQHSILSMFVCAGQCASLQRRSLSFAHFSRVRCLKALFRRSGDTGSNEIRGVTSHIHSFGKLSPKQSSSIKDSCFDNPVHFRATRRRLRSASRRIYKKDLRQQKEDKLSSEMTLHTTKELVLEVSEKVI